MSSLKRLLVHGTIGLSLITVGFVPYLQNGEVNLKLRTKPPQSDSFSRQPRNLMLPEQMQRNTSPNRAIKVNGVDLLKRK